MLEFILRKILLNLEPEKAHNIAIKILSHNLYYGPKKQNNKKLNTYLFEKKISNPIGLAAGFDKNAECINSLNKTGFGFIEVGTVTKKPQNGNDKPRLFRLKEDKAIINRMGFNNVGVQKFLENITNSSNAEIPLGINIGKNKNSVNPIDEYIEMFNRCHSKCDYIVLNVSSPNTPNLRDMQKDSTLNILLESIDKERKKLKTKTKIVLKISPDISHNESISIAENILKNNVNGLIIGNTTIHNRDNLKSKYKDEKGGLSGFPLNKISNNLTKKFYTLTQGKVTIISCGGIMNAHDIFERMKNGASLVQIYSGLIYYGIPLIQKMQKDLLLLLERNNINNITEIVGCECNI